MDNTPVRDRLKKKLKKKKGDSVVEDTEEGDIFKMISQVQSVLKKNPALVSKVSNCVNNMLTNSDLMRQLSSQFEQTTVQEPTVQETTCDSNCSVVDPLAASK